jgi:hypothetical protein
MSEHAERAAVPFFADGPVEVATPREVESRVVHDRGRDWPLATVLFGGVAASYAVVIGAIYLALTALI